MSILKKKDKIRKVLLKKLFSLTKKEILTKSDKIKENLCSLPIYRNSKTIMGYYPKKGEVDILGMMQEALREGKIICLPVIDLKKNELYPFEVKDFSDCILGPFGIREPDAKKSKMIDTKDIDIILTPAIAFDYKKNRLGRGKGFYDKFLKKINKNTIKIGLAFDFQILESLPTHTKIDQKVSLIVTERFLV